MTLFQRKVSLCQNVNQSHCGYLIPSLRPIFTIKERSLIQITRQIDSRLCYIFCNIILYYSQILIIFSNDSNRYYQSSQLLSHFKTVTIFRLFWNHVEPQVNTPAKCKFYMTPSILDVSSHFIRAFNKAVSLF